MPWKSRWNVDIPQVSLPTYVFGSPSAPLPETPLLLDAEKSEKYHLSASDLREWCKRFAAGLQKAGLKPGDRVLLFSGNTLFFPVVFLGTIMAGGVFTGANPTYVARELTYQLQDSGAKFLICAEASLDTGIEAADAAGLSHDNVFVFDSGYATFDNAGKGREDVRHWSKLLSSSAESRNFAWEELSSREELERTICLNYSSGTTGVPKGVMITHNNYVSNNEGVVRVARSVPEYDELKKSARWLCMLPMYHAYGQTYYCVGTISRQIPTYVMQKFDFLKMLSYVEKYKITDLNLVPPIAVAMAKHPASKQHDLSSVRYIGSGAAPLGSEVSKEVEQLWPSGTRNMKQGWGMTELTCSACSWDLTKTSNSNAVGELNPNVEAMIVDVASGSEVQRGQRGELWIRGPTVMKGYWGKSDATKETITSDGWLKTGDVAYLDEDGHLFIVDRIKELIKVKGNQVAPAELEALLLEHPAVADAGVVGVTIKGEELPRAYLVRRAEQKIDAQDIQEFMNSKVARHKRLAGGVVFVKAIPKNPSGKILRKVLREQAKAEVGDSEARAARL
ncbi:acetyl-CoA synthetase-like protein [Aureobasidium pullulans]|uniref:Acetyl-CoA synthetase-like protein n=1 Tax=Aureobasidium pullulans TaxID=5580 RepID=A0A4V4INR3_AURPU|nr:acetyl-CoA synthetase-like protein [Aureobasidium pullulans]